MTALARLAALVLGVTGCAGTTGTVTVSLLTAPDSHLLDAVQRLRLTVTQPHQVVEATRGSSGFDLALEIDATTTSGAVIVEGFDAGGALIASGQSPPFALDALNASVAIYVAAPNSIAIAPQPLGAARSGVAAAAISYGAAIAGGLEGDPGAPSSSIAVYNAFDHSLSEGMPMPAPRAGVAMATGNGADAYLFGGTGGDGNMTGTLWRFDTTVAPNGQFTTLTDQTAAAGFARTGQLLVPIGSAQFLITGTPVLEFNGTALTARSDVPGLPPAGAAVLGAAVPTAVFAGPSLMRFRGDQFDQLGSGRDGAAATTLPDGRIAVLGGTPASTDATVVDPTAGTVTTVPGALSAARIHPAVATTSRHVVVAGGTDAAGAPIPTADVLDARTLALVATLPILARTGGFAVALPSDQVLLGGGAPAAAALELFTPEPP